MTDTRPSHLPDRLAITLWDFSWYTMTAPGEPFEDLDVAFAEAVDRGYNTVRICALPLTLFGPSVDGERRLRIEGLGGGVGVRTRWYNCRGGEEIEGRAHLLRLFAAARRYGCHVILSSWEYQQSPSFFDSPEVLRELLAIPVERRFGALADALARQVRFLRDHGFGDQIAYVELHNEVDVAGTKLGLGDERLREQRPLVEAAIGAFRIQHPDVLCTTCYGGVAPHRIGELPASNQVAHFHLYVYGVLGELFGEAGLRGEVDFPTPLARRLLRADAPPFQDWQPSHPWKIEATGVSRRLIYLHDWTDPDHWDLYLYQHYAAHREAMRQSIRVRLEAYAAYARGLGIPAVIGEGYVGYTPLLAGFEEGPVGKDICEYALEVCGQLGYWGAVLCSNSAPHHPFWADIAWQRAANARLRRA